MKRVLTALVLAPSVLWIVLRGPYFALVLLVTAVAGLCYYEYGGIAHLRRAERWFGIAAGTGLLLVRPDLALLVLALYALVAFVFSGASRIPREVLPVTAAQIFGLLYVYATWNTALLLWALSPWWLAFGLLLNWVGDTGAFFVGRQFGQHRLAPSVSPSKTWEGAAASVLTSVLFAVPFLAWRLPVVKWWQAILTTIAANLAGQLGDLAESAMKRGAGIKDSGTLLPGHGGMLDRVDSSLFSLPVLYAILYFTAV